jgi:hypothetical protein
VKYINARTWPDIDENSIEKFQKYYAKYLRQFDGFVVTHTPVFHEIFKSLGKPILILNTTRYESPFTIDSQKWKNLDNSLAQAVREGQTLIYSNNRGDAKYLQHFTGITTDVIPSVCDYVKKSWVGTRRVKIFFDNRQPDYLRSKLSSLVNWKRSTEVLGSQFSWDDLIEVSCVFIVPYNVSTMQLFELSTAGIPVVVPSKRFLAELFSLDCALGEISFYQNKFNGNEQSSVGFQMLEGLQKGRNLTWRCILQKKLTDFLDINLNYQGRKSEANRAVHNGNIQLRAYF